MPAEQSLGSTKVSQTIRGRYPRSLCVLTLQVGWQERQYTHTHTRLTALFPGPPGWAGTKKVKPIWILLKQETVSGSVISWAICKSAPHSRQRATPAPHHSVFYRPDALPAAQPTASKHWRPKEKERQYACKNPVALISKGLRGLTNLVVYAESRLHLGWDSDWIQWIHPFSAQFRMRICESRKSSFDADSLAKPEMLSSRITSHQYQQHQQTTMTSHSTTFTNPDHSICQWIRSGFIMNLNLDSVRLNTAGAAEGLRNWRCTEDIGP